MNALTTPEILRLFDLLNEKLAQKKIVGEIYLVGGAVMCLAHDARPATKDVDGYFVPKEIVRRAAEEISEEEDLPRNWLNDAVKGYLSERGTFDPFRELSNLKVFVASPKYLLALKCLAMRLGAEFTDEADIRFLLRYLNIEDYENAKKILAEFYPLERYQQKTLYALEEILSP